MPILVIMAELTSRCFLCGCEEGLKPHLVAAICAGCSALLSSRGGGELTAAHHIDPDHIIDHVYLGPERSAVDVEYLERAQIGRVLVISETCRAYFNNVAKVSYLVIPLEDEPEASLLEVLPQALEFLEAAPSEGSFGPNCLVHCVSGMSRSASLAIAYVMKRHGKSYEDAFELVRSKRPVIKPNSGFVRQLRSIGFESSNQAK